jgi:hypothetical protein
MTSIAADLVELQPHGVLSHLEELLSELVPRSVLSGARPVRVSRGRTLNRTVNDHHDETAPPAVSRQLIARAAPPTDGRELV